MSLAAQVQSSGSNLGHSPSASPAPETHRAGAATGVTSKANIMNGGSEGTQSEPTKIQKGENDTKGKIQPAEDEGGAALGEGTKPEDGDREPSKDLEPEGGYPEQLHAGKLDGPGPEYGKVHRVTLADRFQGVKEEIRGGIKHNPELKKRGKERMTGELKRKQAEEDRNMDPFQNANEDSEKKNDEDEGSDPKKHRTEKTDEPGLTEHRQAHPTEKGREEQAASVQPQGGGPSGISQQAKENAASGQVE